MTRFICGRGRPRIPQTPNPSGTRTSPSASRPRAKPVAGGDARVPADAEPERYADVLVRIPASCKARCGRGRPRTRRRRTRAVRGRPRPHPRLGRGPFGVAVCVLRCTGSPAGPGRALDQRCRAPSRTAPCARRRVEITEPRNRTSPISSGGSGSCGAPMLSRNADLKRAMFVVGASRFLARLSTAGRAGAHRRAATRTRIVHRRLRRRGRGFCRRAGGGSGWWIRRRCRAADTAADRVHRPETPSRPLGLATSGIDPARKPSGWHGLECP